MTWPAPGSWIDVAVKFQTAIAAALGFGGVIITLLVNAANARRLEMFKAQQKRYAVEAALCAELDVLKSSLQSNLDVFRQAPREGEWANIPKEGLPTEVFDAIQSDIGLLPEAVAGEVVRTYLKLKELPRVQALLFNTNRHAASEEYFAVVPDQYEHAAMLLQSLVDAVDRAIAKLREKPAK